MTLVGENGQALTGKWGKHIVNVQKKKTLQIDKNGIILNY